MPYFVPKPGIRVEARQYKGDPGVFDGLLPVDEGKFRPIYREPVLLLEYTDRPDRLVHLGDWVSWDGQIATVHSAVSFARLWAEEE